MKNKILRNFLKIINWQKKIFSRIFFPLKHLSERNQKIAIVLVIIVFLAMIPISFYILKYVNDAYATTETFTTDGTTDWEAPAGVTSVQVEAWGAGADGNASFGKNGGGGGAYAKKTVSVTPGNTYTVKVGYSTSLQADSYFNDTSTVLAKGSSSKTGGSAASSIGDVTYSGGDGGNQDATNCASYGAGGGGGAGDAGNGSNGNNVLYDAPSCENGTGGSGGTSGGGAGGDGHNGVAGDNGTQPGGGGGAGSSGGNGASGKVILTYTALVGESSTIVSWWKFDEGTGTTTKDSSARGVNGTLAGTTLPTWQTKDQCIADDCLYFNGISSNVTAGTINTVKSISFWVKSATSTASLMQLASGVDIKATSGVVGQDGFTSPTIYVNGQINGIYYANKWNFISITSATSVTANSIILGKMQLGVLNGFMDEVKFYNYQRTENQILADYNRFGNVLGAATNQNLSNGLVGYWKLDENTGTSAADNSGNSNTGTFAGGGSTSTTFYPSADDTVESSDTTYSTARAGSTMSIWGGTGLLIGQANDPPWRVRETFIGFDTSSLPDNSVISSATLSLYGIANQSWDADDELRVRLRDYGASIDTGDYVAGASLSGVTPLLAHWSGTWSTTGYNDFTDDAMPANVSLTGTTKMILHNKKLQDGTATPTQVQAYASEDTGTSRDPKLVVTYSTPGANWSGNSKFGSAYDYEGDSSEYAYSADSTSLSITGSTTLTAWIKPESVTAATLFDIAGKWDGGNESYLMAQFGDEIRCYVDSSSNYATTNAANLVAGTQYHVACVYNATTTTVTIYVNGEISASTVTGTIPSSIVDDTGRFQIGGEDSTTTPANFYDGVVDETRVYNRTLSPAEIQQLYNFAPGPVGYWKFEEKTGTAASDSSSNSNEATLTNNPTWTNGKYGTGINFAGSNQHLIRADDSDFDFGTAASFTYGAWIKHAATPATVERIITKYDTTAGNGGFALQMETDGDLTCGIDDDETSFPEDSATSTAATYDDNNWHYINCVKDGTTGLYLYIDGVLIASDTSISSTGNFENADPLYIGIAEDSTSNDWVGQIDEPKIYNYARTSGQIVEDMNAGHPAPGSPVGSPLVHLKFDDGFGNYASNSGNMSASGNSGLYNFSSPATSASGWTQNGRYGKALLFDGVNDYASVPTSSSLDFTTGFTLSAWIYRSSTQVSADSAIISKISNSPHNGYMLYYNSNTVDFYINQGNRANSTTTIPANEWTHVMGVWDGTNAKIYINGRLDVSSAYSTAPTSSSEPFYIGKYSTNLQRNFTGGIDDVKVFNSALTASQVKLEYNQGQSLVLGAISDTSGITGGNVASNSASAQYCIPGDTTSCSSPVGEWHFEEHQGTTANDSSGNENTGTLTGNATWAQGKYGSGLTFDGNGDYVNAGTGSSISITGAITVEAWVKVAVLPSDSNDYSIVAKDKNTGGRAYTLDLASNGAGASKFRFYVNGGGNLSTNEVDGPTNVQTNTWYHVVGTYVPSTSMHIYINGVLADTNTVTSPLSSIPTATANLTIGAREYSGVEAYFNGVIDEPRIYNYSRSASQVVWDYNQGKPVGHWKFDECTGSTLNDSIGTRSAALTIGASGTQTSAGTCTTSGAWSNGATGKYNYSMNFDGTDDYAVTSASLSNMFSNGISVSAWVKYPNFTNHNRTVTIENAAGTDYDVWLQANQTTGLVQFGSGGATKYKNSSSALSVDTWYHILGVTDYTNGGTKIYINGRDNGGTVNATPTYTSSKGTLDIGRLMSASSASYGAGQFDDIRVFNYPLTAAQVRTIYNQGGAVRYGPSTGAP
ncbi:hypothetical protein A2886_03265 [candidate division WWE3 bacterium RIFCSPHIGHO2_01_FULL_42_13]|uniref:LamG-like jellyroll fold domain-containing protein n=1 Tax=candidate division WWE3 bacterium RIFCSPHIGHO2_01_FULL_42_13 TaxID=1802617 RepID=A0A1F4URH9_UNCKA|nr:MAG: hypothetical protein A2886_03265 [candidate division WWE3 bacterium RIFCSPHIGHO2_01_FULL_42_13]